MPSLPDRPEVLTEEVRDSILYLMRMGNFYEVACTASGTTRETVEYWRRLCESGVEHAQKYADFFTALKKNGAIAEAEALNDIRLGADSWQSRAWFLERRYPKRWGRTASEEDTPAVQQSKRISIPAIDDRYPTSLDGGQTPEGGGVGEDAEGAAGGGAGGQREDPAVQ